MPITTRTVPELPEPELFLAFGDELILPLSTEFYRWYYWTLLVYTANGFRGFTVGKLLQFPKIH